MPSIFSKNCVNVGEVDSYCLVCSKRLDTEEDVLKHILQSTHKENLHTCGYFEKLKDDCIRKAKGVYFCEFCNETFASAARVGIHVKEQAHLNKRGVWLKREGNTIIFVQNKICITDNAWNGIVDDTCVLCNAEFDDDAVHKLEQNHILNLIKIKVTVSNNSVCRKIDGAFQCLTCNIIVSENVLKEHLSSNAHVVKYNIQKITGDVTNNTLNEDNDIKSITSELKSVLIEKKDTDDLDKVYSKALSAENYVSYQDNQLFCLLCDWFLDGNVEQHIQTQHHQTLLNIHKARNENKNGENDNEQADENNVKNKHTKSEILDYISIHYKQKINIDLIKDIIICKQCKKHINFDIDDIRSHMDEHDTKAAKQTTSVSVEKSNNVDGKTLFTKPVLIKKKEYPTSSKSIATDVTNLAKEHGLLYIKDENEIQCKSCNTTVTASVNNIKEHVAGSKHKNNLPKPTNQSSKSLQKVILEDFVSEVTLVERGSDRFMMVSSIANDDYFVKSSCFFGIALFHNKIICKICHIDLNPLVVNEHACTQQHRETLNSTHVITSLKDEFVRQIKSDLFDCVYCGRYENDWDDMLTHLSTAEHKKCKEEHEQMLAAYKEQRVNDRLMENIIHNHFISLLCNSRRF